MRQGMYHGGRHCHNIPRVRLELGAVCLPVYLFECALVNHGVTMSTPDPVHMHARADFGAWYPLRDMEFPRAPCACATERRQRRLRGSCGTATCDLRSIHGVCQPAVDESVLLEQVVSAGAGFRGSRTSSQESATRTGDPFAAPCVYSAQLRPRSERKGERRGQEASCGTYPQT